MSRAAAMDPISLLVVCVGPVPDDGHTLRCDRPDSPCDRGSL